MSDTHKNYLQDLGILIREEALASRTDVKDAESSGDRAFAMGQKIAWYSIITLMLQQASAFGLTAEEIGLSDIDPDRDLLQA